MTSGAHIRGCVGAPKHSLQFLSRPFVSHHHLTTSRSHVVRAGSDPGAGGSFSGEWPMNWSLASYEDLGEFYEKQLLKEEGMGGSKLSDVMSTELDTTTPDTYLSELFPLFEEHTGIPVLDEDRRLIGVVSRIDVKGVSGKIQVSKVMSTPPIAAKPNSRVADAACLMLKHKVHRIPIVDQNARVIGMVTRTDIFTALESDGTA